MELSDFVEFLASKDLAVMFHCKLVAHYLVHIALQYCKNFVSLVRCHSPHTPCHNNHRTDFN